MKIKKPSTNPLIDQVFYNFKGSASQHIDIVPIAKRLLTFVNKERTTAPHRTDFYRIIYFQEGNPVHTVDFEKIKIKSPCILFVHKDRIHKFDKEVLHDGKVFIFSDNFYLRTETDRRFLQSSKIFNDTGKPILLSGINEQLKSLLALIEYEIQNKEQPFVGEVLYNLLNTFLYTAERLASTEYPKLFNNSSTATLVNSFLELIEKNFKKRLSIEKYAALLNVTVNKLNLSVIEVKGKTGKQVVTERVILEAKRLLAYSESSVKEVGFQLGFGEPTNFVKFFHTNVKLTPAEFQKVNR